jgi:hypothetical protein
MGNLTFAVAGNGPANNENICDLLSDWLGFGEKDAEGYYTSDGVKYDDVRLILPLTDEHFTPGVSMVHRWSALANLGFVGVISSTTMPTRRDVKGAKGEADDLHPAENVYGALVDLLNEADPSDEKVLLVLLEDTDPDEETRALIEDAFEHGITTVLNLSYGLAPLEPPAAPEPEPEPQDEAPQDGYAALAASQDTQDVVFGAAMRERPRGQQVRDHLPLVDQMLSSEGDQARISYREVVTTHISRDGEMDGDPVGNVFGVMERLLQFHSAYDKVARMQATGVPSGSGSPLTDDLLRAVFVLQKLLLDKPAERTAELLSGEGFEDVYAQSTLALHEAQAQAHMKEFEAMLAPAKPERTAKTRTEFFNEETQTWEPKGRGRPRKGVKLREVPIED